MEESIMTSHASTTRTKLILDVSVQEHFKETVSSAIVNQKMAAADDTVFYVVNLLSRCVKAEWLYDESTPKGVTHPPLAMLYTHAAQTGCPNERHAALRRLGDVALLISGLFPASLSRKIVDVDYYVAMGSGAYGYLSDKRGTSARTRTLTAIFAELAGKFQAFVDVLGEVAEQCGLSGNEDMLRLYETWIKTGSPRAANKLRQLGIEPACGAVSRRYN
jgi:hypothetical protein